MSTRYEDEGITADIVYGEPYNPDWPDAHPYTVTLHYQERSMKVPFYTGSGWDREPDVDDVVECLATDAASIVNARDFEDWAGDLGFDVDSRKAERTYRQGER